MIGLISFGVLAVMYAMGSVVFNFGEKKDRESIRGTGIFVVVATLIMTVVLSIGTLLGWADQAHDIATLRYQNELIAVWSSAVEDLAERVNTADAPQTALLNADTPYATTVVAYKEAVNNLAIARQTVVDTKISIATRKYAPWGLATLFVKE
jgi:hypothetical protein